MASVISHDSLWYPLVAKKKMAEVLQSDWGRLFRNWEVVQADEMGYPDVGEEGVEIKQTGLNAFWRSLRILATCILEAPEFIFRRKKPLQQE